MKKIKKMIAVVLLVALSICLISCGKQEESLSAENEVVLGYTGSWKYEAMPSYLTIDDQNRWTMTDFYGSQTGAGTVEADADIITLNNEDGTVKSTLTKTDTGMTDEAGNTLVTVDSLMFLPTPADELNQTANLPGNFTDVTINYPMQLTAAQHPTFPDSLTFDAQMKAGTDDAYTNITIGFQPIDGFDDYMTKGLEAAKPHLTTLMQALLNNMYGGNVTEIISSECTEAADHFTIVGAVWISSGVFGDGSSTPLRGNVEVRYYGPTKYALVAMTIAPESRIQNYVDIANNMMGTCAYTAGWSTAPKAVPEAPPADAKKTSDSASDDGVAYYWYDSDGDIWYWDGSENYFIGYGSYGYIDDDGYYEANDYDPWSDPGDYGDYYDDDYYDDYSDPGDYYDDYEDYGDDDWDYYDNNDDYAYDDDGWGDYFD